MGRRTWESLPKRPLPGRRNIVISDVPGEVFEGAETVSSIEAAVALCDPQEENFIMGGASVYRQFLPLADRLCLTQVHKAFEGDVFFPEIDFSGWNLTGKEMVPFDESLGFSYTYETWDRIR
jgi:dihydrofolate reductase